jgi:hypothetical protein
MMGGFHLVLLGGWTAEPTMSHAQDAGLLRRTARLGGRRPFHLFSYLPSRLSESNRKFVGINLRERNAQRCCAFLTIDLFKATLRFSPKAIGFSKLGTAGGCQIYAAASSIVFVGSQHEIPVAFERLDVPCKCRPVKHHRVGEFGHGWAACTFNLKKDRALGCAESAWGQNSIVELRKSSARLAQCGAVADERGLGAGW